jgi:hypothetical protein
MDEMIETIAKSVADKLSGYSYPDQAYMLHEIAEKLKSSADECLMLEYVWIDKNE